VITMFHVPFFRPDITEQEIAAVSDVLRSGWLTTGPVTKRFEAALADYIGVSKVAALNAQTNATFCTMRLLGIGPGDEVIVPAYTYSASCSIIYHVGAIPVMIDCAKDSFEMDYDLMEEAINERTKAIIPVDLGGVVCDYDRIFKAVDRKRHLFKPVGAVQEKLGRVAVVADTAHSLGASRNGIMAGAIADFSNFSFHAVKNLTTSEGGAASWRSLECFDDVDLYERYMLLSLHGQTKDAFNKIEPGSWEYDIVEPYYKCNLTDIASAIGLSQLGRYQSMLTRRKEIVEYYYDHFRNFNVSWLEHFHENAVSSLHLFMLRLNGKDVHERNRFILEASRRGVALNVHYKPLPMLSAYRKRGFQIEDFPEAYAQYENEVTLPLFSSITDAEVEYVVDTLASLLKAN
jgi:dTDP-4-amino-4,6-dideoxygalactose transaminase